MLNVCVCVKSVYWKQRYLIGAWWKDDFFSPLSAVTSKSIVDAAGSKGARSVPSTPDEASEILDQLLWRDEQDQKLWISEAVACQHLPQPGLMPGSIWGRCNSKVLFFYLRARAEEFLQSNIFERGIFFFAVMFDEKDVKSPKKSLLLFD